MEGAALWKSLRLFHSAWKTAALWKSLRLSHRANPFGVAVSHTSHSPYYWTQKGTFLALLDFPCSLGFQG